MSQNNLFEVVQTFDVSEIYTYTEWAVKDATGKKLATVARGRDKSVRCLTCDRLRVGGGNACSHVQAVRMSL